MTDRPCGLQEALPAFETDQGDDASGRESRSFADLHCRDDVDAGATWLWQTDARMRLTYVGEQFGTQTGIASAQVIGCTPIELAGESALESAGLKQHQADLAARRPFRDVRYPVIDPASGAERHVQVSGRPIFDRVGRFLGYRGTGIDITAQVDAMRDAARAESRLQDAIQSIRAGFVLFDEHDRLVICNHRYGETDGLDPEAMKVGAEWLALLRVGVSRDHYVAARGRADAYIAERLAHHRCADGTVLEAEPATGAGFRSGNFGPPMAARSAPAPTSPS